MRAAVQDGCPLEPGRDYGLVLEGGGARGAYEIGVWMALRQAGISIKAIAGASVGALNGALICMDDVEKARALWENISYSQIMDVKDEIMEKLYPFRLRNLPLILKEGFRILRSRGFDVEPLQKLIQEQIDEEKIRSCGCPLYMTACSVTDRKPVVMEASRIPEGELAQMLMASSYLLGFKQKRLGGKYYLDGAYCNNVPADVLIQKGCEDIIVIRIYGFGVDTEKRLQVPENVRLYHICPEEDLGGILEFNSQRARRNLYLGYRDGCRAAGIGKMHFTFDTDSPRD